MTIHVHEREHSSAHLRLTDVLQAEHRRIERGLVCLTRLAEHLRTTADVHPDAVGALLDFLREYADHEHHRREERELFPWMQRHGLPVDTGPIAVMLAEHDLGRDHLRHLLASARHLQLDANVRSEFIARAEAYCTLLGAHIDKEDHVLYPMADRLGASTRELYRAPTAEESQADAHWEDVIEHLENEARHWPKPTPAPHA